jgi:hypothetical protein
MDSFPTFSLIEYVNTIFRNTHHIYFLLFWSPLLSCQLISGHYYCCIIAECRIKRVSGAHGPVVSLGAIAADCPHGTDIPFDVSL